MKFNIPMPVWLGNKLSKRTMATAEAHGKASKGWRFLHGLIDVSMRVEKK